MQELLEALLRYAQQVLYAHYMVPAEGVTPQQVARAQALLDELATLARLHTPAEAFDGRLLELYTVIPRKMAKVEDYLVGALDTPEAVSAAAALLSEEQALLDVMAGQVKRNEQSRGGEGEPPSLPEAMYHRLTLQAVREAAECLMLANGTTTTLDVKRLLRRQGYWAVQAHVSFLMDVLAGPAG